MANFWNYFHLNKNDFIFFLKWIWFGKLFELNQCMQNKRETIRQPQKPPNKKIQMNNTLRYE